MRLNAYLNFNGQCESAFAFYEKCLGGKIVFKMTFAESPIAKHVSPDLGNKILHATFALGDQLLGGAHAPPDRYQKPQGFAVALHLGSAAEADRVFAALADKGEIRMPIQETFWAARFGMVVDQFGTPWMIQCEKQV